MSTEEKGFGIARGNYKFFLAGVVLIVLGYLLMMGGGSDDPNLFNPEIFSFRRITLAPLVCLAGFAVIMVAIMRRPKKAE
jgi:membrane-bound ClpP family serine protease